MVDVVRVEVASFLRNREGSRHWFRFFRRARPLLFFSASYVLRLPPGKADWTSRTADSPEPYSKSRVSTSLQRPAVVCQVVVTKKKKSAPVQRGTQRFCFVKTSRCPRFFFFCTVVCVVCLLPVREAYIGKLHVLGSCYHLAVAQCISGFPAVMEHCRTPLPTPSPHRSK